LRLIRPDAKRQHRHNLAPGSTSAADAAVAAALDRLLDTLENLRQEEFQSETVQASQTEATAGITRLPRASNLGRPWWLPVLAARLRYSNRGPYRQMREAVFWCFGMIGVIAIVWLILAHTS
jgi:hypothetical protein